MSAKTKEWPFLPKPEREPITLKSIGSRVWTVAFLFWIGEPAYHAITQHAPAWMQISLSVLTVAYASAHIYVMFLGVCLGKRGRIAIVATEIVCGVSMAVIVGDPGTLVMMTYAVSGAILLTPVRYSRMLGFGTTIAMLAWSVLAHQSVPIQNIFILWVLTFALVGFFQLRRAMDQLEKARDDVAKLAVEKERARVARDLHDVLGHSITTITVKTGLARRLLETSDDRATAIAELRDIEQLSRQALVEVRSTVSGYRTASLANELVVAASALRAAEIHSDLPSAIDTVAPHYQEAFAYVLREGMTNIIRHSNATACAVRLFPNAIEITDNGATERVVTSGNGLRGLVERVESIGGQLDFSSTPTGFRLYAEVKVTA